jgi:hypothetical protein
VSSAIHLTAFDCVISGDTDIDTRGLEVKRPEAVLSAMVDAPERPTKFHDISPYAPRIPRVLRGDFNTPRAVRPVGTSTTWAQDVVTAEFNPRRSIRFRNWRTATPGTHNARTLVNGTVLRALPKFDPTKVFRLLGHFLPGDNSWYWQGRIGRRFDHVFAARLLRPTSCRYIHDWREQRRSDHSAIEGSFGSV